MCACAFSRKPQNNFHLIVEKIFIPISPHALRTLQPQMGEVQGTKHRDEALFKVGTFKGKRSFSLPHSLPRSTPKHPSVVPRKDKFPLCKTEI